MLESHLADIFQSLDAAGSRYLVVGGLAVVAHGHARLTADLDLVIALESSNLRASVRALSSLGYQPSVPLDPMQLADAATRERLVREKHMQVLQLVCETRAETCIDVFVTEPFAFDVEYAAAPRMELVQGLHTPVVSLETLLQMKRYAGRAQDIQDVAALEQIRDLGLPGI